MAKMQNIDDRWRRVERVLVGAWRFRRTDGVKEWAATWSWRGVFYDTYPKATIEEALDAVWHEWQCLKSRLRRGQKSKPKGRVRG